MQKCGKRTYKLMISDETDHMVPVNILIYILAILS